MDKILLIAPKSGGHGGSDIEAIRTPLTGLLILATILDQDGYDVEFYDESFKKPDYDDLKPDYVLISARSSTANRAYRLGDYFKKRGGHVVLGGLHPSFKPKEALKHCDAVVVGEGETVVQKIIQEDVKGIVHTDKLLDLDSIPLPDYDLVNGLKNPKTVSLCASRGCPYDCKFCSLKNMFGRKVRHTSNKKVVDYLKEFKNLKTLCFDEPNFAGNKNRALDLLKNMYDNDIHPKRCWVSVSVDIAENEEILKWCNKVSDFNFVIGFESINQDVLDSYNKRQDLEKNKKNLEKIKDHGIRVEGSFVFGNDNDTKESFQKTVEFCKEAEIDFPAFFPLTPYVGTETRKELAEQGRIFTDNWDYYDNLHVVFHPKQMSAYELQMGVIDCYDEFYNISKGMKHLFKGELFYGGVSFYLMHLFRKMKKENQDFLELLQNVSK